MVEVYTSNLSYLQVELWNVAHVFALAACFNTMRVLIEA